MAAAAPAPASSPNNASSPAPASSRPNATPTDAAAPAATPPLFNSPPPAAATAPLPATPPPVLAASPPPASPPPPRTTAPPNPKPPPTAPPPPPTPSNSAPPPSTNPPSIPRPPKRAPRAPPTASQPPAAPPKTPAAPAPAAQPPSPASGAPPAHASPPGPSGGNHRPSLPTPATAADPARPTGGKSPGSNKSSSPSAPRGGSPSPGSGVGDSVVIAVGVVLAFLVLSLIGAAVWYTKKRRRGRHDYHPGFMSPTSPLNSNQQPSGSSANVASSADPSVHTNYSAGSPRLKPCISDISMGNSRFFTYDELYQITDGFSPQNLLGEGGFGSVYKGRLPDGKEVAVKQLKDGGGQGEREFHAEVETISRVHHRHLVSLVGHCVSNNQRLLVYDFVPNNTLHYHLHGHGKPVLDWSARVKIAAGAARGIAYLHEDCHPRIIHRDIKSSNILLDNNFEALVADFGLARLLDAVTHVTTRVMGTFGYMAPEYASSGKLTERSDVFSFGIVLLELITGRKPVDASRPLGDESLVEWARPLLTRAIETGQVEELVDPRLEKKFNEVELFRMIEAAAACVRHSSSRRPRMSQVVRVLDSLADIDLTNGIQPGQSELFNVANTADVRMFQRLVLGNQDDSSGFSQYSWSSHSRGTEAASGSRIL